MKTDQDAPAPRNGVKKPVTSREDRLKAALKQNLARRKAQSRLRQSQTIEQPANEQPDTEISETQNTINDSKD